MISRIFSYFISLRFIPAVLVFYLSRHYEWLCYERDSWLKACHLSQRGLSGLLLLLNTKPEYRSLLYFRTGASWLGMFAAGQNNLEFYSPSENIGWGLIIWHGFSTVINVRRMGRDCQVWQNVVIGKSSSAEKDDKPIIGDNVRIAANAVVVGEITVANDVVVGAGAVLTKSIEDSNTTIVSQPVRIINRSVTNVNLDTDAIFNNHTCI